MGHVYVIALDLTDEVVYRVIGNFRMSLFMYLSGLVACSGIVAPYWDCSKNRAFVRIAGHRAFVCKKGV